MQTDVCRAQGEVPAINNSLPCPLNAFFAQLSLHSERRNYKVVEQLQEVIADDVDDEKEDVDNEDHDEDNGVGSVGSSSVAAEEENDTEEDGENPSEEEGHDDCNVDRPTKFPRTVHGRGKGKGNTANGEGNGRGGMTSGKGLDQKSKEVVENGRNAKNDI